MSDSFALTFRSLAAQTAASNPEFRAKVAAGAESYLNHAGGNGAAALAACDAYIAAESDVYAYHSPRAAPGGGGDAFDSEVAEESFRLLVLAYGYRAELARI